MKKTILLLFALLIFILSACGESTTIVFPEPDPAANRTEIVYDGPVIELLIASSGREHPMMRQKIALFEKTHPHIRIKSEPRFSSIDDDVYIDKIKTALIAGDFPDLLLNIGGAFLSQRDNNMFIDFYEMMDNDPDFDQDDYYTNVFEAYETNGRLYAFPVNFTYSTVAINTNMPRSTLRKYNRMDYISSLEMIQLFSETGSSFGIDVNLSANAPYSLTGKMLDFIDFDRKECNINSQEFINILKTFKSVDFPADSLVMSGSKGVTLWKDVSHPAGRTDKLYAFRRGISPYEIQYLLGFDKDAFTNTIPVAYSGGGLEPISPKENFDISYCIPAGAKHKDEAWQFIKFLSGDVASLGGDGIMAGVTLMSSELLIPTNKKLFKQIFEYKANIFMDDLANPDKAADFATYLGRYEKVLRDRDKNIQQAYETVHRWNSMSLTSMHYQALLDTALPVFEAFFEGFITAEAAAEDLQNKIWLKLNE
ncbi:MAG: extracellular solute-binding protein [Lachnospiraceae bacterium]|nr:extracellular solute-binding protein [Lachnospiraceae bacterium]